MTTITKLLSYQETSKFIDEIGSDATVLQTRLCLAAVSTFNHAFVHGDHTLITRLLDALPNGQRVKALAYWYGHFSNGAISLSVDKDTKSWKVNKDRFARRADLVPDVDAATDAAAATSFADLTVEKDPTSLTIERLLKSLKRTATNAEMFDGTDIPKVTTQARDAASRAVAVIESMLKAA